MLNFVSTRSGEYTQSRTSDTLNIFNRIGIHRNDWVEGRVYLF